MALMQIRSLDTIQTIRALIKGNSCSVESVLDMKETISNLKALVWEKERNQAKSKRCLFKIMTQYLPQHWAHKSLSKETSKDIHKHRLERKHQF